tara:strand:+ start:99 stop:347 length:249 start_codon:yes stop_codon:yes gene_type:complete
MAKTSSYWLVCPNQVEVRRFQKNIKSDDKFFEYMFLDTGIIVGIYGDNPPLMKTRVSIKISEARDIWKRLLEQGWKVTEPKW